MHKAPTITKATPLEKIRKLAPACRCDACAHGCTMGSGFLADDDAKHIAKFLGITEDELKTKHLEEVEQFNTTLLRPKIERKDGKPYGKCTFYDKKKGCTIHNVKPLQCKISMGCKLYGSDLHAWFVLNHMVNEHDPESIRQYTEYIKAGGNVIPGGSLEELVPNREVRKKILSFEILK